MKDSCSCGKTVYELNGKMVTIHDLINWTKNTMIFKTEAEADQCYVSLTFKKTDK